MTLPEVIRTNFAPVVFGTLFGALVTFILSKLANKTARLRYSMRVERVALAADDPVFGTVRITWGDGHNMRNLYLATLEIENLSTRDFENVEFKVYCANETTLLGEMTSVHDSSYTVQWSPAFRESLTVPKVARLRMLSGTFITTPESTWCRCSTGGSFYTSTIYAPDQMTM